MTGEQGRREPHPDCGQVRGSLKKVPRNPRPEERGGVTRQGTGAWGVEGKVVPGRCEGTTKTWGQGTALRR